jgi:hypothetical protein
MNSDLIADRFKVGRRIKFELSIRPRTPSGILLAVHGDDDYMILQMVNGSIKFTVDNGKGPVSSSYATQAYDLCDGEWHTVQGSLLNFESLRKTIPVFLPLSMFRSIQGQERRDTRSGQAVRSSGY